MSFQSPSLRGSGRFRHARRPNGARRRPGFNPLHCGAVVASSSARGWPRPPTSFNPLHCGAVVASGDRQDLPVRAPGAVSIPFIAGQWSLRAGDRLPSARAALVSIPFIAGQWSLRAGARARARSPRFQSPSLRGSGRFRREAEAKAEAEARFNPLHCGAVVASPGTFRSAAAALHVSIPFIAGQWSLPLRTTPFPVCAVLLPNLRPACDHLLWACLHRWPKPAIIP